MTREEAIKIINCYDIGFYDLSGAKIPADKLADAFDMAIEALQAKTDGDLISRQDALKPFCVAPDGTRIPEVDCDNFPVEFSIEFIKKHLLSLPSAEAVQGWIPCSEGLPKDLEPVNATWVNHNPPCYYMDIMNVPFTGTCVRYKWKWYWWDATICDVLEEYGEQCGADPIDKYIEVTAWQPLPTPYEGGDSE